MKKNKLNVAISLVITSVSLIIGSIFLIIKITNFINETKRYKYIVRQEDLFIQNNPLVDFETSLEEAEKNGFRFRESPNYILGYKKNSFQTLGNDINQVTYFDAYKEDYIILRKGPLELSYQELSGDYKEYDNLSVYCYDSIYVLKGKEKGKAKYAFFDIKLADGEAHSYMIQTSHEIDEGLLMAYCEYTTASFREFEPIYSIEDLFKYTDPYYSDDENYNKVIKTYADSITKKRISELAINSNEAFGNAKYEIAYISKNKIPAILVSFDCCHPAGIHIFQYIDGEVYYLGEFSSYGAVRFSEFNGYVYSSYGNNGIFALTQSELVGSEMILNKLFLDNNGTIYKINYQIPEYLTGGKQDKYFEDNGVIFDINDEMIIDENSYVQEIGDLKSVEYDKMHDLFFY